MSASDDQIAQLSAEWGAGALTDNEYQRRYEALDAMRRRRPPEAESAADAAGKAAEACRPRQKEKTPANAPRPASGLACATPTRRDRFFGFGRPKSIDRNLRAKLMHLARSLKRRVEGSSRYYGTLTGKTVDVFEALLFRFLNIGDGRCFPGYRSLAAAAGCAVRTVATAVRDLERAGLLTWSHRLRREREFRRGLGMRTRVLRTSNTYEMVLKSTECNFCLGTTVPDLISSLSWSLEPSPTAQRGFAMKGAQGSGRFGAFMSVS